MPAKTIVLTGGCGFIGTWILRRVLDDGDTPVVFDLARNTSRWEMILSPAEIERVKFVSARVDDDAFPQQIAAENPDAIIHLAGLQVPACRENPVAGAKANVIGALNVFEAAKLLKASSGKTPKVVYASSAAVFGPDAEYGEKAIGDLSQPKPNSHYGAYKLCNENCAKAYWLANQIPSAGLRPLTVYGPGRDTGMTSFPTRALAAAIKGQAFDIPFSGPTAYIHAREVADMFVQCARRLSEGAKTYTVGGDIVRTAEFIRIASEIVPAAATFITCSGGDLPVASKMDDAALRADIPGLLRLPLKEGIAETVDVFKRLHAAGKLSV
jgi:nucleoside-diphosphate-sugar epimerase